jgi:hypothetical protein
MIGDILSTAVSVWNAEKNRDAAYEAQTRSQDFSADQSATQYQRAVADLNAAGLSPMLAYSKGGNAAASGSPVTGTSSVEAPKFGETANRLTQNDLTKAQIELARSQRDVNIQTAKQVAEQARRTAYEVDTMLPTQLIYDSAVKGSQINSNTAQAGQTSALEKLTREGKAPQTDTSIVRNLKEGFGTAFDGKSYLDSMISNMYKYGKSKLGVK